LVRVADPESLKNAIPPFSWHNSGTALPGESLLPGARRLIDPDQKGTNRVPMVDAIGLALFTAIGAHKAFLLEAPGSVAIVMGLSTGAAGGVIRDVLANRARVVWPTNSEPSDQDDDTLSDR
jgi:phosphoribosylformylglycinamidine (FGAM) synthase-like enzyme